MDSFAILIQCVDGRIQLHGNQWVRDTMGVKFVDTITFPGPEKYIADGDAVAMDHLRDLLGFLGKAHNCSSVTVAAHEDCAGHPASRADKEALLRRCGELLRSWNVMQEVHLIYTELNGTIHLLD